MATQHCNHIRKKLWSFLWEETNPAETIQIQEHLQNCPSCQDEYEKLRQIQAAMQTDVSSAMPENFAESLHLKLVAAAEDMAAPSFRERLLDGLERFRRHGAWKTIAPALVCLVLTVGVFSTGLYQTWQNANPILNPTPAPTQTTVPAVTPSGTTVPQATIAPPTQQPGMQAVTPPPATQVPTPTADLANTPATVAEEPVTPAESEHMPAPASMEPEIPIGTYGVTRTPANISCLSVPEPLVFLDGWQEDWQTYQQDENPQELIPGCSDSAIVLELDWDTYRGLTDYAEEKGILPEPLSEEENQGKTLVVITGSEE